MSEMIERAKRAIGTANDPEGAALAVIQELRVPSPEMLAAAARLPRDAHPSEIWRAMVDAAR